MLFINSFFVVDFFVRTMYKVIDLHYINEMYVFSDVNFYSLAAKYLRLKKYVSELETEFLSKVSDLEEYKDEFEIQDVNYKIEKAN